MQINNSYSNYLNIHCNSSKETSSLIDKTSNQNANTPFTQSTRQDTQNIEYNSSKAFQEVSKQDLDNIINDNHDDFQSSILENFLDSLNYCTIGAINKNSKDTAFNQEDFKNAKANSATNSNKTFEKYPLDNYGFMGNEFLKESGLPEGLKFHSNSLQAIKNYLTLPFYEHHSDGNDYFSNYFDSVDLGGGLKNAFDSLEKFIDIKDNYTKEELLNIFKDNEGFIDSLRGDIALVEDYTFMENGEEKIALEGVIMLFSLVNYGEAYAKSENSQLGEYGKYLAGLPNSWLESPSILQDSTFQETSKKVKENFIDWFLQKVLEIKEFPTMDTYRTNTINHFKSKPIPNN